MTIRNARIESTQLGETGRGFSCWLHLDYGNSGQGFGGYYLGDKPGMDFIKEILKVVGVDTWEELKGKYIRVEQDGQEGISGIGNLLKDVWLRPRVFFADKR